MKRFALSRSVIVAAMLGIALLLVFSLVPSARGQDSEPPPEATPVTTETYIPNTALDAVMADMLSQADLQGSSVLDTFTVPVDGTVVKSNLSLDRKKTYTIRVSGTYVWGGCDPYNCPNAGPDYLRYGDAEYLTDDRWTSVLTNDWPTVIYLELNGANPYFGRYNAQHAYNLVVTGHSGQLTFRFRDCAPCYADNSGQLYVQILGENTQSWWQGAWNALGSAARRLGMTTVELYSRLRGLGPMFESLTAAWQINKAGDVGERFHTPEGRAQLIDEAYYKYDGQNKRFIYEVNKGVEWFCVEFNCPYATWGELPYSYKINEELLLRVYSEVGGGFPSGYVLPTFGHKWLE